MDNLLKDEKILSHKYMHLGMDVATTIDLTRGKFNENRNNKDVHIYNKKETLDISKARIKERGLGESTHTGHI